MKILMLGWELPPHNSGGLGVACYQMCKHLALRGVSIDFVLPYSAPHDVDFMTIKSATSYSPQQLAGSGGAYDSHQLHSSQGGLRDQQEQYIQYVKDLLAQETPDIIHAHDWLTFEAGVVAKEITNRPLIAHVHATEFDRSGEHSGNPLVHDIEYNGLMMADQIIAVSQITKDIIVKNYDIPADKIKVVHNSVDGSELHVLSTDNSYVYLEAMKKRGYKVVVTLGRLTAQKGMRYLLESAQKVLQINDKVLFLVAGAGELRNELIAQSAELGIAQNVLFSGFVRGKRWRDAYAIADVFVMSSVSEPFGLTALEAAAHDNALVISKQSGVNEVLLNTLKFDYWDTTKLANQILAIIEHPNLQNALARNAKQEFDQFSWDKTAEKYLKIYENHQPQGAAV